MNLYDTIETFKNGLMWVSLSVLAAIAVGCVFAFPFGTGVVHRLDVLSGGMVEPLPRPSHMSICSAREWASIVPGVGRFWWGDAARPESAPYRSKLLTWENVYAGRDRTGQYNAQIELDATLSNGVEVVFGHDADGDGAAYTFRRLQQQHALVNHHGVEGLLPGEALLVQLRHERVWVEFLARVYALLGPLAL